MREWCTYVFFTPSTEWCFLDLDYQEWIQNDISSWSVLILLSLHLIFIKCVFVVKLKPQHKKLKNAF